jgi:hypothetical protein
VNTDAAEASLFMWPVKVIELHKLYLVLKTNLKSNVRLLLCEQKWDKKFDA